MSKLPRIALTFLMGCIIFLVIPILAWGVTDFRGFLDNPARAGYVVLVLVMNAFAAWRIPEVGKTREAPVVSVRRQHLVVNLLQVLSISIVVVGPLCDRHDIAVLADEEILRWIGLGLYAAGFLAMHFSEAQLGKHFSLEVAVHHDHRLVTNGLYRHLRHPRYLGIIIFSTGISLLFRSWIGLLLSGLTVPVLLWRIHDEEALMHQQFGSDWEAYCRGSWRLVPFLF